jgi:hypothetical protein
MAAILLRQRRDFAARAGDEDVKIATALTGIS